MPHTGPICKGCGIEFYYDYIPERHDGSGYCWICFGDHKKRMEDEITKGVADLARLRLDNIT